MARINLTPMAEEKQKTIARINGYFQSLSIAAIHQEQDWAYKRTVATAVRDNGNYAPPPEFSSEAALRSMDVAAYAALVLSKGDPVAARSLARQTALQAVESATTLNQLTTITEGLKHG